MSARLGGPQCTPAGSPRRSKQTYESTYCRNAGAGRAPITVAVWSSMFGSVRAASGAYGVTPAWLLSRLIKGRRLGWWTASVIAAAAVIDVCAVARNVGTAFSIGVMPLLAATLVIAALVLFQPAEDRALRITLGAGLALAVTSLGLATARRPKRARAAC